MWSTFRKLQAVAKERGWQPNRQRVSLSFEVWSSRFLMLFFPAPPGPRPASLIITKNDSTSQFQLLRSSSIEYEDIEAQQQHATIVRALRTSLLEQQEDESAPLVFTVRKW